MSEVRTIQNVGQYIEGDLHQKVEAPPPSEFQRSQESSYYIKKNRLIASFLAYREPYPKVYRALCIYAKAAFGTSLFRDLNLSDLKQLAEYRSLLEEIRGDTSPKKAYITPSPLQKLLARIKSAFY